MRNPVRTADENSLRDQWVALFKANPWLEGLEGTANCQDVFCCPDAEVPDWNALTQARGLLFLLKGSTWTPALSQEMIYEGYDRKLGSGKALM